jgi:RHS repeat-associated protein
METISSAPIQAKQKLVFSYDHQGRRIRKVVYNWNSNTSQYYVALDLKFIYDAWNIVAELNGTNNTLICSYMWGSDLSGSMQGAAGVGGLLCVNHAQLGGQFPMYDGNGNLLGLVNAIEGTNSASREYSPFGALIRRVGGNAPDLGFSTKFTDEESSGLNYGYRYLAEGRWLSRDPIGEMGGNNLNGFVGNDPVGKIDPHGLFFWLLTGCSKPSCKCKSVTVKPAGAMSIRSHFPTLDVIQQVSVTIQTEGNPSLCKCKHVDDGNYHYGYPTDHTKSFDKNNAADQHPRPCSDYTDVPGLLDLLPMPPGTPWSGQTDVYHLNYNMTISLSCEGTDGQTKTGSSPVTGDFWFDVTYNSDHTVRTTNRSAPQ